jgi:plastocyanin
MTSSSFRAIAAVMVVAVTAASCGGGSSTPTTPTPPTSTTPPATTPPTTTPTDSATITIGSDGRVSPSTVTITRGGRVTMINNHNRNHEMTSDPHPEHSDCPDLNQWGFLQPGQQRTSGNLNTARTCRFHDHNEPSSTGLQGSVIIQ